jgi:hypothetical protein
MDARIEHMYYTANILHVYLSKYSKYLRFEQSYLIAGKRCRAGSFVAVGQLFGQSRPEVM